jgi:two-component system chemotaxis response regulator CheB
VTVSGRRVLVVDDSPVFCRILKSALESIEGVEVVGLCHTSERALTLLPKRNPDLVTLDVHMPEQDGRETLRLLRERHPGTKVLMVSSHTQRGAVETVECLQLGASDYLPKPVGSGPREGLQTLARGLREKLDALLPVPAAAPAPSPPPPAPSPAAPAPSLVAPALGPAAPSPTHTGGRRLPDRFDVLAIASSTGGPAALTAVIPALSTSLPVPVVVVQHILPEFTRHLANSLDRASAVPVGLAEPGELLRPGHVYLAPSGGHTVVVASAQGPRFEQRHSPPVHGCRPAADVCFRSLPAAYGPRALCAVLTGIGEDGAAGAQAVREAGGWVLAQDPGEAVAFGMPRAVVRRGLADEVLRLAQVGPRLGSLAGRGRP